MFVSSERFWNAVHSLDFKLLLIPLAFLLLRIWSFIEAIVYIYMGEHLPDTVHHVIIYLSVIMIVIIHVTDCAIKMCNHNHLCININCMYPTHVSWYFSGKCWDCLFNHPVTNDNTSFNSAFTIIALIIFYVIDK